MPERHSIVAALSWADQPAVVVVVGVEAIVLAAMVSKDRCAAAEDILSV